MNGRQPRKVSWILTSTNRSMARSKWMTCSALENAWAGCTEAEPNWFRTIE